MVYNQNQQLFNDQPDRGRPRIYRMLEEEGLITERRWTLIAARMRRLKERRRANANSFDNNIANNDINQQNSNESDQHNSNSTNQESINRDSRLFNLNRERVMQSGIRYRNREDDDEEEQCQQRRQQINVNNQRMQRQNNNNL